MILDQTPTLQESLASADGPQESTPLPGEQNPLFPVFLKLETLRVLLVGGGYVALEKLQALLDNAPSVQVDLVATEIFPAMRSFLTDKPQVHAVERAFAVEDLDGKDIVFIAVNHPEASARIRTLAKEARLLVNVADKPALCDFYLGSVVQKGSLKMAISTNGKSPTMAKRLKEVLQQTIPDEFESILGNLQQIRKTLRGDFQYKVHALNKLTSGMVENRERKKELRWRRIATYSLTIFAIMLIGHFIFSYIPLRDLAEGTADWYLGLDKNFHWMLLAGFIAQMVDGALGMGYGVTSATILLSAGISPAAISGSIHTAEMFAAGASGYSHYRFGNVNKKLFKALVVPGVIGAVLGAILLTRLGESHIDILRPIMAAYTLFLGLRILINAFRAATPKKKFKRHGLLAGVGGFLDSFGGGGWGPIVTTTLITRGRSPKYVIGSVSLTEFFVTLASAFTFFTLLGVSHWQTIVALVIGGLVAAPLAAKLAGKLPRKTAFILLGLLVIFWSMRILIKIV
jgi:siroheme synthase-like protein